MSTKDDALIEKMADAIDAIPAYECKGKSNRELCKIFARAALAVARKAILEEAADHFDNGTTWGANTAAQLRSLANQG